MTDASDGDAGAARPEAGTIPAFEARLAAERRARTLRLALSAGIALPILVVAARVGEVSPARLVEGLPDLGNYIADTLPVIRAGHVGEDVGDWMWGLDRWLSLILDTLVIAFLGTLFGAALALSTALLAARNLTPHPLVGTAARRLQEVARTVPELVFALIFVYAFGVGPLAGVLAVILHSWGALGKLTGDAAENVEMGPVEALLAAGCTWLDRARLAVLPQILPLFTSYLLFRFEINVRAASVLGIVGAGGIGQELYFVVRQFEYPDISAILVLIVLLVTMIDIASGALRRVLIGAEGAGVA